MPSAVGAPESDDNRPMTQRVAVVTGANRGLGLETCRQLLARGLRVAMTGRDQRAVEHALDGLRAPHESAMAVAMDVTDTASIKSAHRAILKKLGAVDVVINNAAILLFESAGVLETPLDGFRKTFETNCFGVIEVCREFVPPMAERGYGRVVNVSSGAGQLSRVSTYAPAYSISKTALNAFTRVIAASYRGSGVLANVVDPGWVRTDMGGRSAPRSVQEGADTTVWLATLDDNGPTGGFFRDRRPIDW
jgi:NAD(P)-dependent dehydrogenase (short-subunit alcohol dehydrogenase family)